MAKVGVGLKIDVSNIDKDRLHKGAKGTYLDATAFIDLDELDQYGNSGMITQDVSKEERQAGTRGEILGNTRVFWKDEGQAPQQNSDNSQSASASESGSAGGSKPSDDFDESIPF